MKPVAVNYPAAATEADIAVTGTYATEKYFRGNGRWVKVMECKPVNHLSVAFGREGQTQAFEVWTKRVDKGLTRTKAKAEAVDYILHG